jgi:hypothetical protein
MRGNLMKIVLASIMASLLFIGCATSFPPPYQSVVTLSSGDKIEYVVVDAKDAGGMNTRVVDRYYKNPADHQLIMMAKGDFAGQGILNNFFQGGFAGLAQAAGFIGGMSLLRPSNEGAGGGATVINDNGQVQYQGQNQRQAIQEAYQKRFGK